MSHGDELEEARREDMKKAESPSKDLTLKDPMPDSHQIDNGLNEASKIVLRRDVPLSADEDKALKAFQGSMAWDQIDDFLALLKEMGERPMFPLADALKEMDARFPLNCESEGVKARAKHPALLYAKKDLPGAESPSSIPPATSDAPSLTPPPANAPESPSADAPADEASAPSPELAQAEG